MSTHQSQDVLIAVVDDDAIDRNLFRRVLERFEFPGTCRWFEKGQRFLDWLAKRGEFEGDDDPRPVVVFLDIGLPAITGKEILQRIRADDRLMRTPVVMLSGSNSDGDYCECVRLGANGYLIKTSDLRELEAAMRSIIDTWAYASRQLYV